MAFEAKVFKVLISSPTDVQAEREIVVDLIREFNSLHSTLNKVVLLPVAWETHTYPLSGQRPQEIINKQIVDDSDLLVGIFWTRLGTPTGVSESGTVEEIERHLDKNKPAMLYFSQVPVVPTNLNLEQLEAVGRLKDKYKSMSLYAEYENLEKFKDSFRIHLTRIILTHDYFKGVITSLSNTISTEEENGNLYIAPKSGLSDKETKVLLYGAKGDGKIIWVKFIGGEMIQTSSGVLLKDGTPREVAEWKSAFNNLRNLGLIELLNNQKGSEIYSLTHSGFEVADRLAKGVLDVGTLV